MGSRISCCIVIALLIFTITGLGVAAPRVAVLDFLTFNEQGELIEPIPAKQGDLLSLSRIMAQGIASRLVQHGEYNVIDNSTLREEFQITSFAGFADNTTPLQRARTLLYDFGYEQVIIGSITLLQTSAVIGVQRYQIVEDQVRLTGSAMASAPKITEAPGIVDTLVSNLFPADVQIIERAIDQVFVVPSQVRLNLGASQQISAFALDNMGRPISNPDFLFLSNDEDRVSVDENGVITALQPGTTTITVRGVSHTARSGPPSTLTVNVVPPALGVRLGTLITKGADEGWPIRLGLRLTPSFDQSKAGAQVKPATTPTITETTNPLSFVSSFFSSLLTNGLMTFDLDFDPNKELIFALNGVQRSSTGYIGTGVGYVTPLEAEQAQGFTFRFTVGTQLMTTKRMTFPVETVLDMMFPTSSTTKPVFRLGINIGFDLFP